MLLLLGFQWERDTFFVSYNKADIGAGSRVYTGTKDFAEHTKIGMSRIEGLTNLFPFLSKK